MSVLGIKKFVAAVAVSIGALGAFGAMTAYADSPAVISENYSTIDDVLAYTEGPSSVKLSWYNYYFDNDGYIVEQQTSDGWMTAAVIDGADEYYNEYVVTGLSPSTQYTFRISSFYLDENGEKVTGIPSVIKAYTSPETVKGLKLSSRSANSLGITWNKNNTADGYIIYLSEYEYDNYPDRIGKITKNSTVTYTVKKLYSSTKYYIFVQPYKMFGSKAVYGNMTMIGGTTNPSVTTGLILDERGANYLSVMWDINYSADGYIIYKKVGNEWVRKAKITDPYTYYYKLTGLSGGTAYSIRVQPYHMVGKTALYGNTKTITARTNPAIVKNLKLKARAANALTASWDKNTSADGYIIYKYDPWDGWKRVKKITKNSVTECKLSNLDASTEYSIRVEPYKMSGKKALYGNTKTISACTSPKAVTGLKLTGRHSTSLDISWNSEWSADGYIIYKKVNGDWVRVKKLTDCGYDNFTVTGLSPAKAYELRVQTYKMVGKKALYGNTKTIKVYTSAGDIKNLTAKALTTTSAKLSWSASKSAKGYYIEEMIDYDKWKKVGDTANTTITFKNIPKYGDKIYRVRAYFTAENKRIYTEPEAVYVSTYIRYDPTQAEIKAKFKQLLSGIEFKTAYKSMYLDKAPYSAGSLTDKTLKDALNMVNFCRYIAGLPDDVELDSVYNEYCQAGALLLQVSNFAHYPDKPSDMSDDLYYKGATGTSNSNIAWGFNSLPHSILSYMDDSYPSNIDTVGHRLWILSPYMKYTGFGAVDNKYTMLSLDSSRICGTFASDYFTWPPKNMPYEIYTMYDDQVFGDDAYAFSVSLNSTYDYIDESKLTVDISSQKLSKKWHLDKSCNKIEKYLHVSAGRGMAQCIIFNVGTFPNNDKVTVTVNGLTKNGKSSPITYTVNFFSAS